MVGRQFDWGGRLLNSNGGARRSPCSGWKSERKCKPSSWRCRSAQPSGIDPHPRGTSSCWGWIQASPLFCCTEERQLSSYENDGCWIFYRSLTAIVDTKQINWYDFLVQFTYDEFVPDWTITVQILSYDFLSYLSSRTLYVIYSNRTVARINRLTVRATDVNNCNQRKTINR